MPTIPGPGRCIYCSSTEQLSDEHIIPQSLGGKLVLEKASCECCRKITSSFETVVARKMYWPLRMRLGLLGNRKHKKERPTHWRGELVDGDAVEARPIEVGKYPRIYSFIEMPPPGLIAGRPPSSLSPEVKLHLAGDKAEIAQLLTEVGAEKFEHSEVIEWGPFCRLIAKVCHVYAVSRIGLAGVDFCLPPIIRGTSDHLAHFVGGISDPTEALESPSDLALGMRMIGGQPHLVAATTFFGQGRFPTYVAVVGRITDLDLITAKMS